jgi:hypothetical protein
MKHDEPYQELCVGEVSCTAELEETDIAFMFKSSLSCAEQRKIPETVQGIFGMYAGSNDTTFAYTI